MTTPRDQSLAEMRQVLQHHDPSIDLSLVAPVYEEEDNLEPLFEMVSKGLETSKLRWELVLVDDGSSDDSWNRIVRLGDTDPRVRGVRSLPSCRSYVRC